MRTLTIILVLFFTAHHIVAQIQQIDWAKQITTSGTVVPTAHAIDSEGNIYTTGFFGDTVDFNPGVEEEILVSMGWRNAFVVKLNAKGEFEWAGQIKGGGISEGYDMEIGEDGFLYIIGGFTNRMDFDLGQDSSFIRARGSFDVYVWKLDFDGNHISTFTVGGPSTDFGTNLEVDKGGNIYIGGSFEAGAYFDPGQDKEYILSKGESDLFFVKLDSEGQFLWAESRGDTLDDNLGGIAVDPEGNLVTAQRIEIVDSTFDNDLIIERLRTDGRTHWKRILGGDAGIGCEQVLVDSNGDIVLIGGFRGKQDFDPGQDSLFFSTTVTSLFVLKLDSLGDFKWAGHIEGSDFLRMEKMDVDQNNNIYIAGYFRGSADFDPGDDQFNLTPNGEWNGFLLKLDSHGQFVWVEQIGSNGYATCRSLILDEDDNILLSGNFNQVLTLFDSISFIPQRTDMYLVKFIERPLSVFGINSMPEIRLWPNPTEGQLFAEIEEFDDLTVSIYDAMGNLTYRQSKLYGSHHTFPVTGVNGIYLVVFDWPDGSAKYKVVKVK